MKSFGFQRIIQSIVHPLYMNIVTSPMYNNSKIQSLSSGVCSQMQTAQVGEVHDQVERFVLRRIAG